MIDLVTDALAVFRLTRLTTTDLITQPLRDEIALRSKAPWVEGREADPRAVVQPWAFVNDLTSCEWCSSIWLGFGVAAARTFAPRVWRPIGQALAFSACAGLIAEHT